MTFDFDYERATVLLDFIEAASKHGPAYNALTTAAQDELAEMQKGAKEVLKEIAEEKRLEAEAEAEAARPVPIFPDDSGTKVDPRLPSTGEPVETETTSRRGV